MASVQVSLEIKSTGEETLKRTATGFDGVGNAAKRSEESLNSWTNSQQRAAQKMERMQEEALKMNASLTQTNDKARMMADTLGAVSSTATASAAALGLPVGPLTTMNSLLPLVATGWTTLTTAAVGFNAASIGVVGAGLAIGGMIGTWLRTFPAVAGFADKLANSLFGVAAAAKVSQAEQQQLNDAVTKQKDEALKKQLELMRAQGKSWEDIKKYLADETKGRETAKEMVDRQAEAEKKLTEEAKRGAATRAADAKMEGEKRYAEMTRLYSEIAKFEKAKTDIQKISFDAEEGRRKELEEAASRTAKKILDDYVNGKKAEAAAADKLEKLEQQYFQAEMARMQEQIAAEQELANSLMALGNAFGGLFGGIAKLGSGVMGVLAGLDQQAARMASNMEKYGDESMTTAQKMQAVAQGIGVAVGAYKGGSVLGGAASGAAFGAQFGPWGAAIGAAGGAILGFIGKAKRAREEMEKLRAEFLQSVGGMEALRDKAGEAGISLDAMFKAKNAKELQSAIASIKGQLDTWDEATKKTNEAIERYGFTIDELGPRLSQQRLDEQFGQLYQDFQLLNQAGVDQGAIFEKMGPSVNAYIAAVKQAGGTIPEAMRPILQQFLDAGQLTDEFGNKLESLDGLSFSETLTEQVQKIVSAVQDLVDALKQAANGFDLLGNVKVVEPGNFGGYTPKPLTGPPQAEGGYTPFTPGGVMRLWGEKEAEYAIPESKMGKVGGVTIGAGAVQVNLGNVSLSGGIGLAEFQQSIEDGTAQGVITALKAAGVAA